MNERIRIASLMGIMVFGMTATILAQERPSPAREARLFITSVELLPAQPIAGQEIQAAFVVENRGTTPSGDRSRFIIRCAEIRGEPSCPEAAFEIVLPAIAPGQRHRTLIPLGSGWSTGRYRLAAALEAAEPRLRELDLVVQSPPVIAARPGPRAPAQRPEAGEARELNPRPAAEAPARAVPPSRAANPPNTQPERGRPAEAPRLNPQPEPPSTVAVPVDQPGPAHAPSDRPAAPRPSPTAVAPAMAQPPTMLAPAPGVLAPPSPPEPEPAAAEAVPAASAGAPVMGTSAQLNFVTPTLEGLTQGPTEITVYKDKESAWLIWTSPHANSYEWRWQVALWPFPQNSILTPPALLQDGAVPAADFQIDLGSFPPLGQGGAPASVVLGAGAPAGGNAMAANPPVAPAAGGETVLAAKPPLVSEKPPSGDLPPAIDEGDAAPGPASAGAMAASGMNLAEQDPPALIDVPIDFHIRLIPMKNGQLAGPPSNPVIAHYVPGPDPADEAIAKHFEEKAKQEKLLAEMSEKAKVFEVAVLSWKPYVFENVGRWGCIVVVKNPYEKTPFHPLASYAEGEEYCPPLDPSKQQKDWDEQVWEGIAGFGKAWDGIGWAMDQAKKWVASKFAETLPCEWLGDDLESDCESVAQQVAEIAISVGLVAAGVPPSLPSIAELGDMAEGKVVEGAVNYTCDTIESNGGACTPEMRAALEKIYQEALDQLQANLVKQAQEPGCGDSQTAKELGHLPLLCFNDYPGTEVKPAAGSVEESPQVTLRVRRLKPDPDFALSCQLKVGLFLQNYFPGGTVGGSFSSKHIAPGPIEGFPFKAGVAEIPPLAVGQSTVLTVSLGPKEPYHLPGNHWSTFQWVDWIYLYRGGKGSLTAYTRTSEAIAELPTGYHTALQCSEGAKMNVQIPEQL